MAVSATRPAAAVRTMASSRERSRPSLGRPVRGAAQVQRRGWGVCSYRAAQVQTVTQQRQIERRQCPGIVRGLVAGQQHDGTGAQLSADFTQAVYLDTSWQREGT